MEKEPIQKIKILFTYKSFSPFIKYDLEILRRHYDVEEVQWKGYIHFSTLIKVIQKIRTVDLCYSYFENYRSAYIGVLGKLFGKKTIVVAAGGVTLGPEWDKLKHLVPFGRLPGILFLPKLAVNLSDMVFAVSDYKKSGVLKHTKPKKLAVVPNCIDVSKYEFSNEKENSVLTVCFLNRKNIETKGLKTFIEAAKILKEIPFYIIGKDLDGAADYLRKLSPSNLKVITDFGDGEIVKYMKKCRVYAQLSLVESFGVALAEAMLCGCVPVSTRNGNLPEVAGDTGFYCEYGDVDSTVDAISKALESGNGKKAHDRIIENFPLERREKLLIESINNLISIK